MKKIYLLLGFVVCALASCLEDKGNELYIELNDVTVERIRDTTVEQFTRLKSNRRLRPVPASSMRRIILICGICIQLGLGLRLRQIR